MGKANRNRKKGPRFNPAGANGFNVEDDVELNGTVSTSCSRSETVIQSVTDQIQSNDPDQRVCGLHRLAEIFDESTLTEVLKNKIVRIAGPLLVDPHPTVRNAAAGALRNLSVNGGSEVCDVFIEQDLMTPLAALLHKFGNSWQPKVPGTSENDEDADTFIQAVNLSWNLCESSQKALQYFNEGKLLSILVRCLDVTVFGLDVALAVAECLHAVTEDNRAAATEMQQFTVPLLQLLNTQEEGVEIQLLKILISGILLNINDGGATALDPSVLTVIMATVSCTLTTDHRQMLNRVTSDIELDIQKRKPNKKKMDSSDDEIEEEPMDVDNNKKKAKGKPLKPERKVDKLKEESEKIQSAGRLLEAQQFALEILTNLCSGEDDEDQEMDDNDSDSEEMSDSSLADDSGAQESIPVSVSSDVLEAVVSQRLLTKVWDKTILPAENVYEILQEHPDCQLLVNRLNLLRSRAFLCLQNMVGVMDLEELGGCDDLYKMWLDTTTLVFSKTKENDIQLLESATSVMRAAVQRLAQAKATQFTSLNVNDLQMLFRGEQQCKDANVRANLIRIVGSIGQMLTTVNSPLLLVIGKFLLDSASRDSELWVTAEALDCIFDVFGEDETDIAAKEICLVDKLQALVPSLKSKIRMQKKTLGDHSHIVMTANTNLTRFIKYKGQRLAKMKTNGNH